MPKRKSSARPPSNPGVPTLSLAIGALALLAAAAVFFWPRGEALPAAPSTTSIAGGQLVAVAPVVDLGLVPFDVMREVRYELQNTGTQPVRLVGQPQVATLEGCWPDRPTVSSTVINPGQKSTLLYRFIMHPGMGGPHKFEITLNTDSRETPKVVLTLVAQAGT